MENNLPNRKGTRLKEFDYGHHGAYFITICTEGRRHILSEIVADNDTAAQLTPDEIVGVDVLDDRSKGFEKCVAVISEGTASVVVKCENGQLTPAQLAQINTAVYEFSGIEPVNVTVIGRP